MKKMKVILITIICCVVLVFVAIFVLGNVLLTFETESEVIEIPYLAEDYELPEIKCSFLGLSAEITKENEDIDVSKLGEGEVKYSCKKLIFYKTKTFKVKIVDKTPPEIKLNGNEKTYVYEGIKYKEKGATAEDNLDGDLTDDIVISGEVDPATKGEYEIKYTVSDKSGNNTTVIRKVVVTDKPSSMSCGEKGYIYLTFDDGPNATYTPVILDVLKKYDVKATFFVTNSGPDELIKREYEEGHVVGLHTASHDYAKIYSSVEAFFDDLNSVKERVKNLIGIEANLTRFPGGVSNTVSRKYKSGIMTTLSQEVEDKGYSYFDWNISSGDAGETTDPEVEYRNVIGSLSKQRGNVVLMHDIKKHTSLAIENIVKYGINNGYKFAVLDESVICHQKVNN